MVQRDPGTRDLSQLKLRVADDVLVWPVRERGKLIYRLEIPSLHRFYRVGYEEYVWISLLNGQRTLAQVCGLAAAKLGPLAPTTAQAGRIARWLLQNDLAVDSSEAMPRRNRSSHREASRSSRWQRWFGKINPFWLRVPLPKLERVINHLAERLVPMFDARVVMIGMILIVAGAAALFANAAEFSSSTTQLIHPGNWFWLLISWVGLKVIHELAHAVACRRHGVSVRESGLVLILLAPMAYVDVTSCWRLNARWSRIAIAAAGMYVEMVIAALAVMGWIWTDDPLIRSSLHNLVLTAGLSTLLFNANPLMRFDGYYMLADLIEIPNLYQEASGAVQRLLSSLLAGNHSPPSELTGWRRYFVVVYGMAALAWKVTICVSLAMAAATLFAGAGIVLAWFGVYLWVGPGLRRLARWAWRLRNRNPLQFARALLIAGAIGLLVPTLFFYAPIPTSIRVSAVSRNLPESIVRGSVDGFVSAVHVHDGSAVRAGQLLLELENRELSAKLLQLEATLEQNAIRLRQATERHDPGQRHVLQENQQAIALQLDQLRSRVAGLKVYAPRDGQVIARGLEALNGTYVHEGDPLLIVASPGEMELIALVPQADIDSVRSLVGSEVSVRTASYRTLAGRLDRIEPRADRRLQETALAATEGGALAVESVSDASKMTHCD